MTTGGGIPPQYKKKEGREMQKITVTPSNDDNGYVVYVTTKSVSGVRIFCDEYTIEHDDKETIGWVKCCLGDDLVAMIILEGEDEVWFSEGPWDMGERIYPRMPRGKN